MKPTVLVTGGDGFIGTHLVHELRGEGYEAVIVDTKSGTDIRDYGALRKIFAKSQPHTVVHLASEVGVRPSIERPADYILTNVLGIQTALEMVRDFGVKQFVFASSSSVYGKRSGKSGFMETDSLSPISPYGVTKIAAEELCRVYASTYKIPTTVLRFFTVYGPNNRRDMACFTFTKAIAEGKVIQLFGKSTKRDFTYVTDIVDGILRAIKNPYPFEIINLGNSSPVLLSTLVQTIADRLGMHVHSKYVKLPSTDVPVTFANIDKAKKLLDWEPKTSLEMGIKHLVQWYLKL